MGDHQVRLARQGWRGKDWVITLIDLPFSVSPAVAGLLFVLKFGTNSTFGVWLVASGFVVSAKIRGQTTTMPLMIEMSYNEYLSVAAFTMAGVLALLALVTLTLKTALEWRCAEQVAATHRH